MAATETGRTEQIISQFLLKVLHIVLDSRIPHLCGGNNPAPQHVRSGGDRARKRDRWFNLNLGEPPAALESLGFWHRSVADPMVIDVLLFCCEAAAGPEEEVVVERWTVHYESSSPSSSSSSSPSSLRAVPQYTEAAASFHKRTYKKSILLLRSLYSTLRLLPAYKAFRMLSSTSTPNNSNQNYNFNLSYKVSSFAEPFYRAEEDEMKHYHFAPVETQFGHLALSVAYRPDLSDFNLEASSSFPPRIISDYVGSPAADPMRVFPSSLPYRDKGAHPTSFPLWGVARSGSSAVPFSRPHSWTSTSLTHHPLSMSPSTASESLTSPVDVYGQHVAGGHRPAAHRKGSISLDEYRLSPPQFSPSSTPSPPIHCGNPLQSRLQSETSPVSIPVPALGKNPVHNRTPNFSDPTRSFLPPPSPRSTRVDLSSQDSPESRSFRKLDVLRAGEYYLNMPGNTIQKGFRDCKDDSGRFSGILSAGGSPRVGFSRSSSRLSLQDDLDDCEFSCPFAVDDVDTLGSQTRNLGGKEASEAAQICMSFRKSQDAAVGDLVHMLKTAPPLRQDPSYSSQSSKSGFDREGNSSCFFVSRKTSDALEELRSYKDMKDMLLSQSKSQLLGSVKQRSM